MDLPPPISGVVAVRGQLVRRAWGQVRRDLVPVPGGDNMGEPQVVHVFPSQQNLPHLLEQRSDLPGRHDLV